MLKLNTDEEQKLSFEVMSINGINHKELKGSLKFIIDGVDYGFPVEILQDHISVTVPSLDSIIKKGLKDGEIVECKLDIFGNGFYLNPWESKFKLQTGVKMEAKLAVLNSSPLSEKTIPTPKSKVIEETKVIPVAPENSTTKHLIEMLMSKLTNKQITERQINRVEKKLKSSIKGSANKKEVIEEKLNSKLEKMSKLVDKALSGKRVVKKPIIEGMQNKKTIPKKVQKTIPHIKSKNQKQKDPVRALMESYGFKNHASQSKLIERAKDLGGDDTESILTTVKRFLDPTPQKDTAFEFFMQQKYKEDQ